MSGNSRTKLQPKLGIHAFQQSAENEWVYDLSCIGIEWNGERIIEPHKYRDEKKHLLHSDGICPSCYATLRKLKEG